MDLLCRSYRRHIMCSHLSGVGYLIAVQCRIVVRSSPDLQSGRLVNAQPCCSWAGLCLTFLICKMDIIIEPAP